MKAYFTLCIHGIAACSALFIGLGNAAGAQTGTYPTKPIRFLVGFNPGGGTDITARVVGDALSRLVGQTVIIDNRAASGGVLARRIAADANPDGYTLLMLSGSQVIGASLVHKEPVDMKRDFAAISRLTSQPYLLTTHPSVPAKNVKEIVALAKSQPGKLNYGSTGVGSMAHLATELFKEMAKIDMVHIPYKGASPGLLDLIRGQLQFLFASATSSIPHVKAGRVRLIASSSGERSSQLPDVPTVAESGLPGFDVTGWYGIVAPARTPKSIITKLNVEIGKALKTRQVIDNLAADGADVRYSTPEQLTALVAAEEQKWAKLVKATGMKLK